LIGAKCIGAIIIIGVVSGRPSGIIKITRAGIYTFIPAGQAHPKILRPQYFIGAKGYKQD
jgi:hypothetical protein